MSMSLRPIALASVLALFAAGANAMTVNFTDEESPGVSCCGPMDPGAYGAYGLTVDGAYWYADSRDTFDGEGVSIYDGPTAMISFAVVSPTVDFEYFVIDGNRGHYEAFDSAMGSLGSLDVDATGGDVLGTHSFGGGVKYLSYSGGHGFVQVSAVTYAVPEPATYALMLGGLGLLGAAVRLRRE